jgi:glucose/arabinose dehydrogenase
MAFYDNTRIPQMRGDLFVASATTQRILRVRYDPNNPMQVLSSESLLEKRVGPILTVLSGPDGAIYFCTETTLGRIVAGDRSRQ